MPGKMKTSKRARSPQKLAAQRARTEKNKLKKPGPVAPKPGTCVLTKSGAKQFPSRRAGRAYARRNGERVFRWMP